MLSINCITLLIVSMKLFTRQNHTGNMTLDIYISNGGDHQEAQKILKPKRGRREEANMVA